MEILPFFFSDKLLEISDNKKGGVSPKFTREKVKDIGIFSKTG